MTILIGLLSPLSIGVADHIGTNVGRRGRLLATVLAIYVFTLLSTLILAVWWGGSPTGSDLLLGSVSGVSSGMGLIQLYRGYTTRGTGIVGPVAAVTGAVVPIGVDTHRVGHALDGGQLGTGGRVDRRLADRHERPRSGMGPHRHETRPGLRCPVRHHRHIAGLDRR